MACEIKQQELLVTELIFENVMEDLHYTEIAALLSCVVFEQKNCSKPNLAPSLKKVTQQILVRNPLGTVITFQYIFIVVRTPLAHLFGADRTSLQLCGGNSKLVCIYKL